jgi:hypothetical protein
MPKDRGDYRADPPRMVRSKHVLVKDRQRIRVGTCMGGWQWLPCPWLFHACTCLPECTQVLDGRRKGAITASKDWANLS